MSLVTMAAKTATIATPVAGEYSPDANGRFGLLTWRGSNISALLKGQNLHDDIIVNARGPSSTSPTIKHRRYGRGDGGSYVIV
jgi:hypothetical protein